MHKNYHLQEYLWEDCHRLTQSIRYTEDQEMSTTLEEDSVIVQDIVSWNQRNSTIL